MNTDFLHLNKTQIIVNVDRAGFSIRNGVDGRIWEVGGEIVKDAEGELLGGPRGMLPWKIFGLLECISRILGHE